MDRQTALDKLELIRVDGKEFQHPDFAEAWAVVESDAEARAIFAQRQRLDREIAQAMRAVPIPEGLKNRLNAALAKGTAEVPTEPAIIVPTSKRSRRWFISASVVVASCALAALGLWFWGERPEKLLTISELANQAEFDQELFAKAPDFDGNFNAVKPNGLWASDQMFAFSSPAKGLAPNRDGIDRAAAYEFYFRDPRQRIPGVLRGVMLVAPKSQVADPPERRTFLDGNYGNHQSWPGIAIRSWSEGDYVYVCLLPIAHDEALASLFDVPAV